MNRRWALLLMSVWDFDQVTCNDLPPAIRLPLIDRAGSTFDFIPLSGTESHEQEHFSMAEPLPLFPISAGGTKDDRNRYEGHFPDASTGPSTTLGEHRANKYLPDLSANNEQQSSREEILSLFPLAPGGAKDLRERVWNTPAEQGHLQNSPGASNRENPSLPSLTTRRDTARLNLVNHQGPSQTSGKDLQTGAPMDLIAETPPRDSKMTAFNPPPGSPATSKTRVEQEETRPSVQSLAEAGHVPTPGSINTVAPEEGTDSQKRFRDIVSEADHDRKRLKYTGSFNDLCIENLFAADRWWPPSDGSRSFWPWTSDSRNLEIAGAPMNLAVERAPPSDSEKTVTFWNQLSKQTLEWKRPMESEQANLAAYFMAIHFKLALLNIPSQFELEKLHESHHILIPFAYRLLMKPLSIEIWGRILVVWRNLWHEEREIVRPSATRKRSTDEVLKKFLWISNFICETTIPELFRDSSAGLPDSSRFRQATSKIIKILSDGRVETKSVLIGPRESGIHHVRGQMVKELGLVNRNSEVESESERLMRKSVLDAMAAQADPITPDAAAVKKVPTSDLFDKNSWTTIIKLSNGVAPHAPCLYMRRMPRELKPNLKTLFARVHFDYAADLRGSPIPSLKMDELISFDRQFGVPIGPESVPQDQVAHLPNPSPFLPQRINRWFHHKFVEILQAEKYGMVIKKSQPRKNYRRKSIAFTSRTSAPKSQAL
ncbi:hypothetical protein PtB15_13B510, partial [Puccinia triticina]